MTGERSEHDATRDRDPAEQRERSGHEPREFDAYDADNSDPPPPATDPRLEIPEILRRPVRQPDLPKSPVPQSWGQAAQAWGVALDFIFTVVAGALLGWLIDRWLGWGPIGILSGLALGFVAAFVRIIRYTQRAERRKPGSRPQ